MNIVLMTAPRGHHVDDYFNTVFLAETTGFRAQDTC